VTVNHLVKWKRVLKSWDRFQVAIPFSECHLVTGTPVSVPENASEDELKTIYAKLSEGLGDD
jgi:lysophospholipid acyltransferase (LPLAT)-like uncharacterized protein